MSKNGLKHFINLAANAVRFLKCVCSFFEVMHEKRSPFPTNTSNYFQYSKAKIKEEHQYRMGNADSCF